MRDTIILAGGFNLATMSASTVRALGMAALFEKCGYKVLILGKLNDFPLGDGPCERVIAGIHCRDIRRPIPGVPLPSYVVSAAPLMAAADLVGVRRVRAICAYNYPARGAYAMIRACRSRGIAPVLDCTEWQIWEGRKILRNLWRLSGLETRMRLLTRLAGNVICASTWFQKRLARQHTVVLPFALDTARPEWRRNAPDVDWDRSSRFVYSGSPGVGMVKDRLPPMIEAMAELAREGRMFEITIAGMTAAQYLETVPRHAGLLDALGERLRFLGRIPHHASLDLLRNSDFMVFFRKPNRIANTGFATKFVEAVTLGIPVITNATSDIPHYLEDGTNGLLAEGPGAKQAAAVLRRAIEMPPEARAAMVAACRARNPFELQAWTERAGTFLENLRGLDG